MKFCLQYMYVWVEMIIFNKNRNGIRRIIDHTLWRCSIPNENNHSQEIKQLLNVENRKNNGSLLIPNQTNREHLVFCLNLLFFYWFFTVAPYCWCDLPDLVRNVRSKYCQDLTSLSKQNVTDILEENIIIPVENKL